VKGLSDLLLRLAEPWTSYRLPHLWGNPWRAGVLMDPESREVLDTPRLLDYAAYKLRGLLRHERAASDLPQPDSDCQWPWRAARPPLPECFATFCPPAGRAAWCWPGWWRRPGWNRTAPGADVWPAAGGPLSDRGLTEALGGEARVGELADFLVILVNAMLYHRRPNGKEQLERRTPKSHKDKGS
jgi:hypothetical protein